MHIRPDNGRPYDSLYRYRDTNAGGCPGAEKHGPPPGDYDRPKARLPGSGGGNDVGSHCWNTIAIMRHDRMRFVQKLDFLTTPGYLNGPGAREPAGWPTGTGPYRVVTNLAVMGYHPPNKRMM